MSDAEDEDVNALREVHEQSREGAPSAGSVISDRFDTDEIFHRIMIAADEEIQTSFRELFFSALAGGFAITITFLLYANLYHSTGGHPVLSALLYPIGFMYIILGRYQLYTENTLPPVTLVLERLASIPLLLYVWGVVFLGNALGGGLGAAVLAYTGVFSPEVSETAIKISLKGMQVPFWSLFFKAGFAGFIVAGVVWLDYAARDTVSRLLLIYIAFLAIPMGDLYHSVVSATETMYLVFLGKVQFLAGMKQFVLPVLMGNTVGGVVLVTVVNYFQTARRRVKSIRDQGPDAQLGVQELLLGPFVGRSYSAPEEPYPSE
jgi:formate/nitrite transporter FocA (FNT family)